MMTVHDTMLLAMLVVLSAFFTGCGNEALRANATIARGMLEIQTESGPLIRQLRRDAAVDAARKVADAGGSESDAQEAARVEADHWQCAIDSHRIFSSSVGAYIDALSLWSAGEELKIADGIPFVRAVIDSYRSLVSCLRILGSDALPDVPSFLEIVPPAWNDRPRGAP